MAIIKEQIDVFLMGDFNAKMQNRKGDNYDLEAPKMMHSIFGGSLRTCTSLPDSGLDNTGDGKHLIKLGSKTT